MAEERGTVIIGGVQAEVRALRQDMGGLKVDMAEVKGEVRQIDKRIPNLENMQRWAFGIMVGTWVTVMLAVLGLYFRR